jgi:hypothetical protein
VNCRPPGADACRPKLGTGFGITIMRRNGNLAS